MYQLIFTDMTGRITLAEDQEDANDQTALSHGRDLLQARRYVDQVEVWNGCALVGKAQRSTSSEGGKKVAPIH